MSAMRLSGTPPLRGEFAVPSASVPGESWVVVRVDAETRHCFCPGFTYRRSCRHVAAVEELVALEARRAVEEQTDESRAVAAARLARIEKEFSR